MAFLIRNPQKLQLIAFVDKFVVAHVMFLSVFQIINLYKKLNDYIFFSRDHADQKSNKF